MSRLHQSIFLHSSTSIHELSALSFGQSNPNKLGVSFPLGTGLVVLTILLVSALFSFCYHWLSIRKLVGTSTNIDSTQQPPLDASSSDNSKEPSKLNMLPCPPVVYMAGEDMPRFIALPCPFEGAIAHIKLAEDKQVQIPIDALVKLNIIRL